MINIVQYLKYILYQLSIVYCISLVVSTILLSKLYIYNHNSSSQLQKIFLMKCKYSKYTRVRGK